MRIHCYTSLVMALTVATTAPRAAGQQDQTARRTADADSPAALTLASSLTSLSLQLNGEDTSGLIHPVGALFSASLARPTFSMISSAVFRQTNGLGSLLCWSM